MINDQTILSSFDDKPTLLEWLKKVEDALKTDTAKSISVENPSANTYVFKITFADGNSISSGNVVFPDSVKDVSIKNGHIIVTSVGGNVEDLGVLNPYADTIVENAETNTTEIGNNVVVGGNLGVMGQAVVGGTLQAISLQVNSNGSVGGGLSVEGALSAKGGVTTAGKVTANDGMEVHGQGYVNGALGVTGNATIGGTITAGGKAIKAVEANPTDEATATLEKVKIGDVAYNVGGASENDKELTLILPYPHTSNYSSKYATIEDESVWNKLTNYHYETIKIYYNDGYPLGVFSVIDYYNGNNGSFIRGYIAFIPKTRGSVSSDWYGNKTDYYYTLKLRLTSSNGVNTVEYYESDDFYYYSLDKSKFDALYKLADKPTQDGNYILKAHVSGGNVTYSWELQQ